MALPARSAPEPPPATTDRWARALDLVAALAIALIAARLWHDHAAWVALDRWPVLDEDSEFHAIRFVREYRALLDNPSLRALVPAGNYPPLVEWVAWLGFARDGVTEVGMRNAQVPFTALLSVGTAVLAWRAWGRAAGVGAAALCVVYPLLWPARSNVMLMAPLAATAAMAYAGAPLAGEPSPHGIPARHRAAARLGLAALGGVALGAALLTHVSAVYFVAPAIAYVLVHAAWRGRAPTTRRAVLGTVGAWLGAAAVVGAPWWGPSLWMIGGIVGTHWDRAGEGLDLYGRLYFLLRLKETYLASPLYTYVLCGLPLALLAAWWRPMLRIVLLSLVGGFAGLLTFPQSHDRYFLPLVPLLTVVAMAPLGVLVVPGPLRRIREVAALGLGAGAAAWGLAYSASSLGPDAPSLRGYGHIAADLDLQNVYPPGGDPTSRARGDRIVGASLRAPPRGRWTVAPRPDGAPVPVAALADIIAADLPERGEWAANTTLLRLSPNVPLTALSVELSIRRRSPFLTRQPHGAPGSELELPCESLPCYAIGLTSDAALVAQLTADGFTSIGSAPLEASRSQPGGTLGVWRR